MNGNIQEIVFSVLLPVYFFGGLAGITVFALYAVIPNLEGIFKKQGLDLGLFCEDEYKKLPAVREHRQANVGICTNGKFENPIKDYNTEIKELQEV